MKTDDQKRQLIVLCVLVIIAVAFGAYKLMGKSTQAASKPVAQAKVAMNSEQMQPDKVIKDIDIDLAEEVERPISRDPFEPQLVVATVGKPKPASRPTPLYAQESDMSLPLFPTEPMIIQERPSVQAEAGDTLRLTGVIEGEVDIAIIRGGDGTRYIVMEGQRLGKYKVESISRTGVRLKSANRSLTLKLGGMETG